MRLRATLRGFKPRRGIKGPTASVNILIRQIYNRLYDPFNYNDYSSSNYIGINIYRRFLQLSIFHKGLGRVLSGNKLFYKSGNKVASFYYICLCYLKKA